MKKTKETIIDAFWQLLEEKPFNKITVQNIVERCTLNRNTFYYHFQDIPNLAEYTVPTKDCEAEKDLRFPAQRGGGRCKPHREHRCIALCGVALLNRNQ